MVATDFDGTLVPLTDRPAQVALSADARAVLTRLATRPGVTVAIASGRRLVDLEYHIAVPGAVLVANHGFEVRLPGGSVRAEDTPEDLVATRSMLAAFDAMALLHVPGVRVEDKGAVIAVHLRLMDPSCRAAVADAARSLIASHTGFTLVEGRDALEIRPRRVHKGSALCRALRALSVPPDALWWYFGDDASDEDVFRTLPSGSVTVLVGTHRTATAARFVVDQPDLVPTVLAALDDVAAARDLPLAAGGRLVSGRPDLL